MSDLNKDYLPTNITTDFSVDAAARLLNPFSGITGGGKEYVPEWWIKLFSSGKSPEQSTYQATKGPGKIAHILAKIGAGAVAYGGAAYLIRAFMHSLDIDNIEAMKAGDRASKKLQVTKTRPIAPVLGDWEDEQNEMGEDQDLDALVQHAKNVKQQADEQNRSVATPMDKKQSYHMALGALPALTAIAAVLTASKLADKTFDIALGDRLDKELASAEEQSQNIALNRVRKNRGIQTEDNIQKKAAFQGIQAALGLLLAAITVAGGITGFNWHRANSPAVANYKAYKKGLETYNKRRNLQENIQSSPLGDNLVEELDSSLKGNKKTPQVTQDPTNEVFV